MAASTTMVPTVDGRRGEEETADDIVGALGESPGCIFTCAPGVPEVDVLERVLLMLAPHFPSVALVVAGAAFIGICERMSPPLPPIFVDGKAEQPPEEDTDLVVLAFMNRHCARRYTEDLSVPWLWVAPPAPCVMFVSWTVPLPPGQRTKSALKT